MVFKKEISLKELLDNYNEEQKILWHFGNKILQKKIKINIKEELEPVKITENNYFYNINGINLISSTELKPGVYNGFISLTPNFIYFQVKSKKVINYV